MSFGPTPLSVPEGTQYETDRQVERLEFEEDGGATFIILHFEAPLTGRATSIRAPITQAAYEADATRNTSN